MDDKNIIHEIDIELRTALNYVLGLHRLCGKPTPLGVGWIAI